MEDGEQAEMLGVTIGGALVVVVDRLWGGHAEDNCRMRGEGSQFGETPPVPATVGDIGNEKRWPDKIRTCDLVLISRPGESGGELRGPVIFRKSRAICITSWRHRRLRAAPFGVEFQGVVCGLRRAQSSRVKRSSTGGFTPASSLFLASDPLELNADAIS
jgi:hypothetical protein